MKSEEGGEKAADKAGEKAGAKGGDKTQLASAAAAAVTAATPESAPAPAPAVKRTPEEWAKRLGQVRPGNPHTPQKPGGFRPAHAAADALHGWRDHAYHFQAEPFEITQKDYEEALVAGRAFPTCAPHAPALPPSQAKRFENFVPRAARQGSE